MKTTYERSFYYSTFVGLKEVWFPSFEFGLFSDTHAFIGLMRKIKKRVY